MSWFCVCGQRFHLRWMPCCRQFSATRPVEHRMGMPAEDGPSSFRPSHPHAEEELTDIWVQLENDVKVTLSRRIPEVQMKYVYCRLQLEDCPFPWFGCWESAHDQHSGAGMLHFQLRSYIDLTLIMNLLNKVDWVVPSVQQSTGLWIANQDQSRVSLIIIPWVVRNHVMPKRKWNRYRT